MNKKIICALGVLGALSALGGVAMGRTTSASLGHARVGSQATCFNYSYNDGSVTSTCNADFIVPLPFDYVNSKNLAFESKATTAGASCRLVSLDRFGTTLSTSQFAAFPVGTAYIGQTIPSPTSYVTTWTDGLLFADCVMNNGASLLGLHYAQ